MGVALGGGGARGLAHAGVLKVLEEEGLRPDFIVGTSIGAVIGGAYALRPDARELEKRIRGLLTRQALQAVERQFEHLHDGRNGEGLLGRWRELVGNLRQLYLWNLQAIKESLVDVALLEELIGLLVGDAKFDSLQLPFYSVAFDVIGNQDVILGRGSLAMALRASASVPGFFQPVQLGSLVLVDGCARQEIPVETAWALGADVVIAVDVGEGAPTGVPGSAAEIIDRVSRARNESLRQVSLSRADCLIAPDVSTIHWSEFSRAEDCLAAGIQAARTALPGLRSVLSRRSWRRFWPKLLQKARPGANIVEIGPPQMMKNQNLHQSREPEYGNRGHSR